MNVEQEAGYVKRATQMGLLDMVDIIAWADATIAKMESAPPWLADLATLHTSRWEDAAGAIPFEAPGAPTADIDIAYACHKTGRITFLELLARAFEVLILDRHRQRPSWAANLVNLLTEWDFLHDPDEIPPDLKERLLNEFHSQQSRFVFADALSKIEERTANHGVHSSLANSAP